MATQAKLPGTLPTPAVARSNLRNARSVVRTREAVLEGLRERAKLARETVSECNLKLDAVEDDLLVAEEGSDQDVSADKAHGEAMRAVERAEKDVEKVAAAVKVAGDELAVARRELAAARADIRAIREGRRVK
jgi:hypothetical protein